MRSIEEVRVLVVEDELSIADFLERGLRGEGYAVDVATDGPEGERRALDDSVDLVILDVMLPGRDGIRVLGEIRRRRPTLPVILLTAREGIGDRVTGLDAGATDYVTKPFSFDELAARVRAHLRTAQDAEPATIEAGDIRLDLVTRRAIRAGRAVALSQRESDLLAYFLHRPNMVLTRAEILERVWGRDTESSSNVVEVYVGQLRRKLGIPGRPGPIDTLRSAGYRLTSHE
jgi:two-component system OmpR family response regulator